MKKGDQVTLIKQGRSHTCGSGRNVKVGTQGEVIATRNNGKEALVKFKGSRGPRHTDIDQVEVHV